MIDIDNLSEAELIDLNYRIVARIRMMRELKAHQTMLEFRIGDRVAFQPDGGAEKHGVIVRYNRKSVSVVTNDGGRWTVSPHFLRRLHTADRLRDDEGGGSDIQLFEAG